MSAANSDHEMTEPTEPTEPATLGKPATEYGLPNDEILVEVPVYLTQKLAKQLHLLQYPQKNSTVRKGELNPRDARIKP
ncbi:hypothetical protein LPJ70_003666, partial [Coemansia sp. RSA 2708]